MKLSLITATLLFSVVGCAGKTPPGFTDGACTNVPATACHSNNVWAQVCNPWLLTSPKIHLVFWGNWWITSDNTSQSGQLAEEWQTLANDPNFYLPMSQYGVGAGSLDGIFYSNWNLPNTTLAYGDIETEIQKEIDGNELPSPDNQSLYVFVLPPDAHAAYDDIPKYSGYHGHIGFYTYAIIEYGSNDSMSITISHEIGEAATNPDLQTGYWAGGGETEIGDNCNTKSYKLDGYVITKLWDQANCQCEPQ